MTLCQKSISYTIMEKYIIQSYLFGFAAPGLCSRAEYRPTPLIDRSFVTSYMCYKKSKDNEHILCGIFSIYVMLPHAYIIFIAKLKLYSFIFIDELRYTETSSSFNCHISYFILIFSKVVCTSRLDFLYSDNMTLS